jgi:hypothetical protein
MTIRLIAVQGQFNGIYVALLSGSNSIVETSQRKLINR